MNPKNLRLVILGGISLSEFGLNQLVAPFQETHSLGHFGNVVNICKITKSHVGNATAKVCRESKKCIHNIFPSSLMSLYQSGFL